MHILQHYNTGITTLQVTQRNEMKCWKREMINDGSFVHTIEHFLSDITHLFWTERRKKGKIRVLKAEVDKREGRNMSPKGKMKKSLEKGWKGW